MWYNNKARARYRRAPCLLFTLFINLFDYASAEAGGFVVKDRILSFGYGALRLEKIDICAAAT